MKELTCDIITSWARVRFGMALLYHAIEALTQSDAELVPSTKIRGHTYQMTKLEGALKR